MTKDELEKLSQQIAEITGKFEDMPITQNMKRLREDFDIASLDSPRCYSDFLLELKEIAREARVLLLHSTLNKVCKEEGRLYHFSTPYQSSLRYSAVTKRDGNFYILDEDGHYRDIFLSENFTQFIECEYPELFNE